MTNAVYNKESAARILAVNIVDFYPAMVINNVKLYSPKKLSDEVRELNE